MPGRYGAQGRPSGARHRVRDLRAASSAADCPVAAVLSDRPPAAASAHPLPPAGPPALAEVVAAADAAAAVARDADGTDGCNLYKSKNTEHQGGKIC